MKNIKNTYTQDNNLKGKSFSSGELTDADYDLIASRSKTTYVQDIELERYWGEEYSDYNNIWEVNKYESQYNSGDTFTIGNNISGGI
ncbi:MAG: hypothetical protein ACR2M7_02525 [Bdellovibrionales bacterium]